MAAATQVTSHDRNKAYGGIVASTETLLANGTLQDLRNLTQHVLRFSSIANTNTHASGLANIKAIFVKSDDVDAVNAPAVHWDANGLLTFAMGASTWAGELLVCCDDPRFEQGKRQL